MSRSGQEVRELHLSVTVDEVNLILEGVGLLPFARVYALVAKVQQQASQQLGGKPAQEEPDAT
ncbi:hypothetical protein [Sorangium cellulosum]|uniref:hypothetical protein n=1 Tax=Sorangium cellulosum TaxID=56 RepID=UPI0003FC205D|nr:hypothetical protein [Sorangium cellulosum]